MTPRIIKAKDFKPENVVFSTPRANKHNGKVVYVNYDFKDGNAPGPLRIQLGKMKAPFGVSGWDTARADKKNSDPTENSNDTLELSFKENQDTIKELKFDNERLTRDKAALVSGNLAWQDENIRLKAQLSVMQSAMRDQNKLF